MLLPNFVRSSRLFLYLGFGLVFLALIFLPAKVKVVVQPEVGETELWHMGPIFSLLIGVWSLPSLLLGIIESSTSKKAVLASLTLILCLVNIVLAGLILDAIRFWRDMLIQWLLNYSLFLVPCLLVDAIAFLYITKKAEFTNALKNPKIRTFSLMVSAFVPLLFATIISYMWLATLL